MGERGPIDPEYAQLLAAQEQAEKEAAAKRESAGLPPLEPPNELSETERMNNKIKADEARAAEVEKKHAIRKLIKGIFNRGKKSERIVPLDNKKKK